MSILNLFINDELAFEYDRSTELDDRQLDFLDRMDKDMDQSFKIHGELIAEPDIKQKATFVSMNLLKALRQEDNARVMVAGAYLATRLPHVVELHARDQDECIVIEFVEQH
jgi:hypothetical protein